MTWPTALSAQASQSVRPPCPQLKPSTYDWWTVREGRARAIVEYLRNPLLNRRIQRRRDSPSGDETRDWVAPVPKQSTSKPLLRLTFRNDKVETSMSINIKVCYRALMTHGLSYDIETRNTNLHSDRPHCPWSHWRRFFVSAPLFWHPPFNHLIPTINELLRTSLEEGIWWTSN